MASRRIQPGVFGSISEKHEKDYPRRMWQLIELGKTRLLTKVEREELQVLFIRLATQDSRILHNENLEDQMTEHCKRSNGIDRAWFRTKKQAEAFAQDSANHPVYL